MVMVVIAIIMIGGGAAVYAASNSITKTIDDSNVQMNCFVSGNDLVAQILEGGAAEDVVHIELVMEGYTMPPAICVKAVPTDNHYPKEALYKDVAAGITGNLKILFKGTFKDGTKKTLWTGTVRFT